MCLRPGGAYGFRPTPPRDGVVTVRLGVAVTKVLRELASPTHGACLAHKLHGHPARDARGDIAAPERTDDYWAFFSILTPVFLSSLTPCFTIFSEVIRAGVWAKDWLLKVTATIAATSHSVSFLISIHLPSGNIPNGGCMCVNCSDFLRTI